MPRFFFAGDAGDIERLQVGYARQSVKYLIKGEGERFGQGLLAVIEI